MKFSSPRRLSIASDSTAMEFYAATCSATPVADARWQRHFGVRVSKQQTPGSRRSYTPPATLRDVAIRVMSPRHNLAGNCSDPCEAGNAAGDASIMSDRR